jgi:alpha-beta hydrolase superfamily lysophospholipase
MYVLTCVRPPRFSLRPPCCPPRVLRFSHPDVPIFVTGHSLGAAMAVLAAAHLQMMESLPVSHVYV